MGGACRGITPGSALATTGRPPAAWAPGSCVHGPHVSPCATGRARSAAWPARPRGVKRPAQGPVTRSGRTGAHTEPDPRPTFLPLHHPPHTELSKPKPFLRCLCCKAGATAYGPTAGPRQSSVCAVPALRTLHPPVATPMPSCLSPAEVSLARPQARDTPWFALNSWNATGTYEWRWETHEVCQERPVSLWWPIGPTTSRGAAPGSLTREAEGPQALGRHHKARSSSRSMTPARDPG